MKKAFSLLFCLSILFNVSTVIASANSAQSHWNGVYSTGAVVTDENCPVVVEKELLTFDISEFPANYYHSLDEYMAYSAKVTAEYTFYNPADYTVTATLVFPFGNLPDYVYEYYDEGLNGYVQADDTAKYNITINGAPTEKTIRHTLFDRYDQFNADEDIPMLCEGYVLDSFFNLDMPITKYQYEISDIDAGKYPSARVAIDIEEFDGKTKVLFPEAHGMHTQKDGDYRLAASVDNGDIITLYVFGYQSYTIPEWKFYKDGGVEDKEEINGTATLVPKGTKTMAFKDFALQEYKANSGIIESDWYNAMVAYLNRYQGKGGYINTEGGSFDISKSLMRWYEYKITLAPRERITNTVQAPIYPDIDLKYNPSIFKYQYLLSPAKSWASFGSLEIIVNTPYYITESNIEGFTKTDTGYSVNLNGLPDGEFEFTMSTVENPIQPKTVPKIFMQIETIIFIVIVVLILVGAITAFVIIRKKKKKD